MDANLTDMMRSGGRNKAWAETMVNLEARKLMNTANRLTAFHLQDGLTRINFVQAIKQVACINNLSVEAESLEEQGRMLRMKTVKLYANVEFVRGNNNFVDYIQSVNSDHPFHH